MKEQKGPNWVTTSVFGIILVLVGMEIVPIVEVSSRMRGFIGVMGIVSLWWGLYKVLQGLVGPKTVDFVLRMLIFDNPMFLPRLC